MKIALLMTGETRHFWLSIPTILKNVIEPNNADVFIYVNKNSYCSYKEMTTKEAKNRQSEVNEKKIFRDCFGEYIKELRFTDNRHLKEVNEIANSYRESQTDYTSEAKRVWYLKDDRKCFHLADEWLKVKTCAEWINGYDIICRIRPDIIWHNPFDITKYVESFYCDFSTGFCDWAKDYLYVGESGLVKKASQFVDFLGKDNRPCIRGLDDLTFTNEIQFAKYLNSIGMVCKPLDKTHVMRRNVILTGAEKYYYVYNGEEKFVNNYIDNT